MSHGPGRKATASLASAMELEFTNQASTREVRVHLLVMNKVLPEVRVHLVLNEVLQEVKVHLAHAPLPL